MRQSETMFNRLVPKRQCIRPYSIANTRITSNIQLTRNIFSMTSHHPQHINTTNISVYHQQIRYFGKKIKVYNQPDVGEGTVEVDILEWLIKEGDTVSALQTIGRGKYEKADVDILAPTYTGTVHKILVEAGSVAYVGKPLVQFEVEDDGIASPEDSKPNILESSTMYKSLFRIFASYTNSSIYKQNETNIKIYSLFQRPFIITCNQTLC